MPVQRPSKPKFKVGQEVVVVTTRYGYCVAKVYSRTRVGKYYFYVAYCPTHVVPSMFETDLLPIKTLTEAKIKLLDNAYGN